MLFICRFCRSPGRRNNFTRRTNSKEVRYAQTAPPSWSTEVRTTRRIGITNQATGTNPTSFEGLISPTFIYASAVYNQQGAVSGLRTAFSQVRIHNCNLYEHLLSPS